MSHKKLLQSQFPQSKKNCERLVCLASTFFMWSGWWRKSHFYRVWFSMTQKWMSNYSVMIFLSSPCKLKCVFVLAITFWGWRTSPGERWNSRQTPPAVGELSHARGVCLVRCQTDALPTYQHEQRLLFYNFKTDDCLFVSTEHIKNIFEHCS